MTRNPRTPADPIAEAKSSAAFLNHDIRAAAATLLADSDKATAMARAREFAVDSGDDEIVTGGVAAAYFWTLVRGCIEYGAVVR